MKFFLETKIKQFQRDSRRQYELALMILMVGGTDSLDEPQNTTNDTEQRNRVSNSATT